jgi:hypothetical protein
LNFGLEPWEAGLDFDRSRFAVNPPGSPRHPFEMLHDIGYVCTTPIDAGLDEAAVEQLARRADKGVAGSVFGIARLLANQHDSRTLRAFAKDGLGRVPI